MTLPRCLFRRWTHSFEEDSGGVTVYRPPEYSFPRARGRAGLEFRANEEFIDWKIGPGDAPVAVPGAWQEQSETQVRVTGAEPARVFEIVQCDDLVLKVRV
jgi:hypothetical protein